MGTREQGRAERPELLEAEKKLPRRGDELARQRRELRAGAADNVRLLPPVADPTNSAYARGGDALRAMYQWLDRAPLGRNEEHHRFRLRDGY